MGPKESLWAPVATIFPEACLALKMGGDVILWSYESLEVPVQSP